ncbi:MAG TPA: hypothetical protein V6D12_09570 [Candidatus Obscuribacterales bacterium]
MSMQFRLSSTQTQIFGRSHSFLVCDRIFFINKEFRNQESEYRIPFCIRSPWLESE